MELARKSAGARRTRPSSVATLRGRATHAPADFRALLGAIRQSLLHFVGRRPGAPKWVTGWRGRWRWGGVVGDSSVVAQKQFLLVLIVQKTIVILQLQFIDKVLDVPVVQVRQVPRVQSVRRQSRSHSCSSLQLDTVVHMPVVVQRQMPDGSDVRKLCRCSTYEPVVDALACAVHRQPHRMAAMAVWRGFSAAFQAFFTLLQVVWS